MYKTSSNFCISNFHDQVVAWLLLTMFLLSFAPSVSLAQQPTATISVLSGTVLVNAQEQGQGTILTVGDVIENQAGASVVLELSDGSQIELGEHTQIDIAVLSQTAAGARVSRLKLLWGRIRAFLSPQHQIQGSSFNIETPNALIGVTFSEPDIEVSYNLEKAETVGIAHTVDLMARSLMTDEETLVQVGSTVFITAVGIKVVAGVEGAVGSSGVGSTGTGSASTGSTGMSTSTKVAIGACGAAAAGGVAALAVSSGNESGDSCTTAECTGDLSGIWVFRGSCVAQGCTESIPCASDRPECCGIGLCDCCTGSSSFRVTQTDNTLSGTEIMESFPPHTLNGTVEGNTVSFITNSWGLPSIRSSCIFEGMLSGNTVRGTFSGCSDMDEEWMRLYDLTEPITWQGATTATIE